MTPEGMIYWLAGKAGFRLNDPGVVVAVEQIEALRKQVEELGKRDSRAKAMPTPPEDYQKRVRDYMARKPLQGIPNTVGGFMTGDDLLTPAA